MKIPFFNKEDFEILKESTTLQMLVACLIILIIDVIILVVKMLK